MILALWILPAVAVTMATSLWMSATSIIELSDSAYDRSLAGAIRAIDSNISTESGGVGVELPYNLFEFFELTAQGRVYFNVSTDDGLVQIGDVLLPPTENLELEELRFEDAIYLGDPVRIGALKRLLHANDEDGPSVTIQVAETKGSRNAFQNTLLERSITRDVAVVLAMAAMLAIGVYFAVRPLRRLRDAIDRRESDDLTPINGEGLPAEVRPLVEAVNRLMQRNLSRADQQRRFLDDASHQLRTPMAVLRTQIDVALHETDVETIHETLRSSRGVLDRSSRTINQLLTLARAQTSEGTDIYPQSLIDLRELVAEAIRARWSQLRRRKMDCTLEGSEDVLPVRANEALLGEAINNILDNAISYARAGTLISVHAERDGSMAQVSISDEGPGMSDEDIAQSGIRFRRGAAAEGKLGSGLGMAIAVAAAKSSGGQVTVRNRVDRSGLVVTFSIPLAVES